MLAKWGDFFLGLVVALVVAAWLHFVQIARVPHPGGCNCKQPCQCCGACEGK